jgi:cyclophilin family peptidyl-prolyl cis-trans isomerase
MDGKHVIFGKVVKGLHVVHEIEKIGFGSGDIELFKGFTTLISCEVNDCA